MKGWMEKFEVTYGFLDTEFWSESKCYKNTWAIQY